MAEVSIRKLNKKFDATHVVKDVDLQIHDKEFVVFVGPSGCGKTTTLRMVAGFVTPTEGSIRVQGRDITALPPNKRDMGMVFQSYALFPHMTVRNNVVFGLKARHVPKAEIEPRVLSTLKLVGLGGFEARYPKQLSGGQQQRVALARVLALRPKLLLSAGKLAGQLLLLALEADKRQRVVDPVCGLRTGDALHGKPEADILAHAHMRKQRVALENHAEAARFRLQLVDAPVAETDFAARQFEQAGDAVERGGLPATGRAEKRDELARLDGKVYAVERVVGAECPPHVDQFEAAVLRCRPGSIRQALPPGCFFVHSP